MRVQAPAQAEKGTADLIEPHDRLAVPGSSNLHDEEGLIGLSSAGPDSPSPQYLSGRGP